MRPIQQMFAFNSRLRCSHALFPLWLLALAAVATGSLLPPSALHRLPLDLIAGTSDKLVHFLNYCMLALLPVLFLDMVGIGIACSAVMIALGVALEFAQRLVPGRAYEVGDICANTAGVLFGVAAALVMRAALQASARVFK